ncbi:MAG: SDR family oxidoreductase, partial [Chloroflexi bacterium]
TLTVQPALPGGERLSHRRVPAPSLTSAADVAQAVVYLCGDGAKHISGTTLYVDGGWLADGYWE